MRPWHMPPSPKEEAFEKERRCDLTQSPAKKKLARLGASSGGRFRKVPGAKCETAPPTRTTYPHMKPPPPNKKRRK